MADWSDKPLRINHQGEVRDFYMIGALASALNRSVVTIRKWEHRGVLPTAPYRFRNRRLYSKAQIEGVVKIAEEEGIQQGRSFTSTQFTQRCFELFKTTP